MRGVYSTSNWTSQGYYPDAVNGLLSYLDGASNNSPYIMVSQHSPVSAVGKKSLFDGLESMDCGEWREKPVREWSSKDTVQWISEYVKENKYDMEDINISAFRVDGMTLIRMSEQDFVAKDRYYGHCLFDALQARKAAGKKSLFDELKDCSKWREKPIKKWTPVDVVEWIHENATENKYDMEGINMEEFHIDGITLLDMTEQNFVEKDRCYGQWLYYTLLAHKDMEGKLLGKETDIENLQPLQPLDVLQPVIVKLEKTGLDGNYYCNTTSDSDLGHSNSSTPTDTKILNCKRPVGRPPKPTGVSRRNNRGKKSGKVWEFIRDLLLNPECCPSLICWENKDTGIFRFVQSQEVARRWGRRRNEENCKMTYEKFSRAMRHNYKTKYLQPVYGRRLVYQFGSKATGWRVSNHNFQENHQRE